MYHGNNLLVGSVGFSLRKKGKYIVFPVKSWKALQRSGFILIFERRMLSRLIIGCL
jgi:RNase P/RNase MRP subunit POP5